MRINHLPVICVENTHHGNNYKLDYHHIYKKDPIIHQTTLKVSEVELIMKSPPTTPDDCDDIFGPPRTYPMGYCPPKNRPSMISPKYRQKEERRKVLKISINKLKKIEDPEASLCRSVLINNTMKRLQREARDEKIQKQQLNYPRYENDNVLNIKSEFLKNESKGLDVDFAVENDFDTKLEEEIKTVTAKNIQVFNELVEGDAPYSGTNASSLVPEPVESRKRSFDDMEDCDVQDVLSQFYMLPTPRMLTCIDEDEDVNVVDSPPSPKRVKLEDDLVRSMDVCVDKTDNFSVNYNITNNNSESRLSRYGQNVVDESNNSYSCGHASMFNDLQSNVYHNLIASLET